MTYDYYCPNCGNEIVVEEKMVDHGKIVYDCDQCHAKLETKITGGAGFQLQGPSWSKDGYCNHGCAND